MVFKKNYHLVTKNYHWHKKQKLQIDKFISENCLIAKNTFIFFPTFHRHYKNWCQDEGLRPMPPKQVDEYLQSRFQAGTLEGGFGYNGLKIA